MRTFSLSLHPAMIALALLLCFAPPVQADQAVPSVSEGARIAAARDRVLPVVVSILTVRQDYRQGEPLLSVSSGSGTVISAGGHIATNAHVTQNGKSFRVVFADGRELPARLVGTDTLSDLAVLQVQPPKPEAFAFAEFVDVLELRPGDTVLAMGAPWGLSNSMSAGVVNNPRRLLVSLFDDEAEYEDSLGDDEPTGRYYAWIQHDASIAPGNSGGPLVDLSGRIVGVNTRGTILGGDLAFAIPGPDAGAVVRQLIAKGRIERVTLGFRMRSLKGTGETRGVLVNAVDRDSPPEKAGLRAGDRILTLNGQPVDVLQPVDLPALQKRIAELPVDSTVVMDVARDGKQHRIELKARTQPGERGAEGAYPPFGISVSQLTPAMGRRRSLDASQGLLVTGVRPGGPAAVARPVLAAGDLIVRVDGKPVATAADLDAITPRGRWQGARPEPRAQRRTAPEPADTAVRRPGADAAAGPAQGLAGRGGATADLVAVARRGPGDAGFPRHAPVSRQPAGQGRRARRRSAGRARRRSAEAEQRNLVGKFPAARARPDDRRQRQGRGLARRQVGHLRCPAAGVAARHLGIAHARGGAPARAAARTRLLRPGRAANCPATAAA